MEEAGLHHLELIILFLLLIAAALAALARRFQTPYPIVLVVGGLLISFVPYLPHISLRPDVVFLVFLPPLLYISALRTSWRDFRNSLSSTLILAFGLVGFTVLGVSFGAGWLLPGFNHRLGAVLGAVIATTDAIAAAAIAKRVGLPRRIMDVLEGESLVNDASGLLALQFAVTLLVTGEHPTIGFALLQLLWLLVGGVGVGVATAFCVHRLSRNLVDPPIEITLSLVAPYFTYLVAEGIHSSGVLAVVACGLYLGRANSEALSLNARLESSAVWNTLDFIFNGIVFILIGLQLPYILKHIYPLGMVRVLWDAAAFSAFVILLRLVWVFWGAWILYFVRTRLMGRTEPPPNARGVFVVGWTGMRGVLALAAAISLPDLLDNDQPFPERHLIIFLAFSVILVTLVLQGLSLPWLIRKLGLSGGAGASMEEREARRTILSTVLDYLRSLEDGAKDEHVRIYADFVRRYQDRLMLIDAGDELALEQQDLAAARYYRSLSRELRSVERKTAIELRNSNRINDELLRALERELDLVEARYDGGELQHG
ncbi:MAG TPA: Na+/H+ antiporter [Acidobacteriaceae bacterium]|jgi:CPA1 family monovalent cation:H+ antiporter|nr:Na+/H+ antiporter [Acidobacteriaceae bacterium]